MTSSDYLSTCQGWTRVPRLDAPGDLNCASQTSIQQGQELCIASGRVRSQTKPNTQPEQGSIRRYIVLNIRLHWLP